MNAAGLRRNAVKDWMSLEISNIWNPSQVSTFKGAPFCAICKQEIVATIPAFHLPRAFEERTENAGGFLVFDPLERIRLANRLKILHGVAAQIAVDRFPYAQQEEGNYRSGSPELGLAGSLGFRFPAEQLR